MFAALTLRELGLQGSKIPDWFAFRLGVEPKLLHKKHKSLSDYEQERATYVRVLYHLYKTASRGQCSSPQWLRIAVHPELRYTRYQVPLPHWTVVREVIRTSCRRLRSSLGSQLPTPPSQAAFSGAGSPDPLCGFSVPITVPSPITR